MTKGRQSVPPLAKLSPGPRLRPVTPRVALIFSGFLRYTCRQGGTMDRLAEQVSWCREAFSGHCDVFLHTWSTIQKEGGFWVHGHNHSEWNISLGRRLATSQPMGIPPPSSWSCVQALNDLLSPSSVAVEVQRPPSADELARAKPWGWGGENLLNMRMQVSSIMGGLRLAQQHAMAARVEYSAAVRMRADLGDQRISRKFRDMFLDSHGWKIVSRRALLHARGLLDSNRSAELVTCNRPRLKTVHAARVDAAHASLWAACLHVCMSSRVRGGRQVDFCQWSVPPDPLRRTIEVMSGEAFNRVVYGGEGCAAYLNRSGQPWRPLGSGQPERPAPVGLPLVSENIMYCAMRDAGVLPSPLADSSASALADGRVIRGRR